MRTQSFDVLNQAEVDQIHNASMEILAEVGLKVPWEPARDQFRDKGALVDDDAQSVKIPESLVQWAVEQAPSSFILYGSDSEFQLQIGPGQEMPVFAGLGTPLSVVDLDSQKVRKATKQDMLEHIILVNACQNIHNTQMDVWPDDIPMTTIHTEAIWG